MSIVDFERRGFADVVPRFRLNISGLTADGTEELHPGIEQLIQGIVWEEDIDGASMLTIDIAIPDKQEIGKPTESGLSVDSKVFSEGNVVEVFIGYGDELTFMGRAEIVKWLPTFPESGFPTLQLKAFDARHRMSKNKPTVGSPTLRSRPAGADSATFTGASGLFLEEPL